VGVSFEMVHTWGKTALNPTELGGSKPNQRRGFCWRDLRNNLEKLRGNKTEGWVKPQKGRGKKGTDNGKFRAPRAKNSLGWF